MNHRTNDFHPRINTSPSAGSFKPSHQPSSSSDFGEFESAPQAGPSQPLDRQRFDESRLPADSSTTYEGNSLLDENDLLGSFDPLSTTYASHASSRKSSQVSTPASREVDLLGGDIWEDATPNGRKGILKVPPSSPRHPPSQSSKSAPIHVPLPPRPSEISPDYIPPLRSPRRMSTPYFSASLSSPPIVTDAGNDIIFHPAHQTRNDDAATEMRRVQLHDPANSPPKSAFANSAQQGSTLGRTITRSPPHHSKLLDTLATTSKIASKWRSAITSSTFSPPNQQPQPEPYIPHAPKSPESLPIDVTHQNPFVSAEQLAGSYTAPTGAPGFDPRQHNKPKYIVAEDEWGHITLVGRRESTVQVLSSMEADKLRLHLPPRQKLSSTWTLIFSLDQHGASLSTLYRLADKFGQTHKTSGNILVVRDSQGNRFGAFINETITKREGTYYGSGESFLFKLDTSSAIQPFRWTGKNQYFALCEAGFISFGGGDGVYGLILDSTFTQNSSATSPAYDNDVLSESRSRKSSQAILFDCVGLEVWGT
ncbi:uncharacterized protein L201_006294 [Kwoniella dendrophila CBS 6074]|uniref:Oxidation resistance protein 1 n=1 Tax=Kwoniella dendrophila CBS 6074 TaxID=1295534 RepID=A0AAX4K0U5_9TREE